MIKSLEMKLRPSSHVGVFLVACLSPLPLLCASEQPKLILVDDPPKIPDLDEMIAKQYSQIQFFEMCTKSYVPEVLDLSVKPISWFIQNKVPLCSVSTVPYEQGRVHKPPWEL